MAAQTKLARVALKALIEAAAVLSKQKNLGEAAVAVAKEAAK